MKSRLAQLEQRRQALLARIETQRDELAWQAGQFRPTSQVASWAQRRSSQSAANHPLAWLAGILSILVMLKPLRRSIAWLPWIAGTLSLLGPAVRIVRLIGDLRRPHSGDR